MPKKIDGLEVVGASNFEPTKGKQPSGVVKNPEGGGGKQKKYGGSVMPYGEPMKDGPPMSEDFHSRYGTQYPDMKGPGMDTGIDKYPEVDSNELDEEDTPPKATYDFWASQKDESKIGDLGSTEGPMFNGKMPADINIKRQI